MIQLFTVFIFFTSFIFSQGEPYSLSFPETVPWNTPFEVSLLTGRPPAEAEILEIVVSSGPGMELKKVLLNSFLGSTQLDFHPVNNEKETGYRVRADLKQLNLPAELKSQFLFIFKPDNIPSCRISFGSQYLKENAPVSLESWNVITEEIEFNKPKKYAGKALNLSEGEAVYIIKTGGRESLSADFWFRTGGNDLSVLNIYDRNDLLADIFINSFHMLSVQSHYENTELHPCFVSRNTWNHAAVYFSWEEMKFRLYCNGMLISSNNLNGLTKPPALKFLFSASSSDDYVIDQLKFSEPGAEGMVRILRDRNFNTPPEGVKLIKLFRYDEEYANGESGEIAAAYSGRRFVKSEAPLGLRAPDLNIIVHSGAYELEWSGGDFRHASLYILERSGGGNEFTQVYSVPADNKAETAYRYFDRKDRSREVVYYRVKQVLRDGAAVYSSQVKVGQGLVKPFSLAQNFPNPFNPKTSIDVEMYREAEVQVMVFNLEGKEIAILYDGVLTAGIHKFSFDGTEFPSGIYICRIKSNEFTQSAKMILAK